MIFLLPLLFAAGVAFGDELPKDFHPPLSLDWVLGQQAAEGLPLLAFENAGSLKGSGWEGGNELDVRDFFLMKEGRETFIRSVYKKGMGEANYANYAFKKVNWDLREYPYLRWTWRIRKFPEGAKINDSKLSDAAAQVYLLCVLGRRNFVLKYFWTTSDPVGELKRQSNIFFGKLFGEVVRSGPPANVWKTETHDVLSDFRREFERDPTEPVKGIAVLSDGDETNTDAEADFKDFVALKKP